MPCCCLTRWSSGQVSVHHGQLLSLVIGSELQHPELLIWWSPLGRSTTINRHTGHMIIPKERLPQLNQSSLSCSLTLISEVRSY